VLFDLWPENMRNEIDEAVERYRNDGSASFMPHNMRRDLALRPFYSKMDVHGMGGQFLYAAMFDYRLAGTNTFVVGPELQDQLLRTSLDKIKRWMIKPPFPAFWIALPECSYSIWGATEDTPVATGLNWNELAPVRGVLVDMQWRMDELSLLLWAPAVNKTKMLDRLVQPDLRAKVPRAELEKRMGWVGNDSYVIFKIDEALDYPGGIEPYLRDRWENVTAEWDWPKVGIEATAEARVAVLKIVLGTILYLQSDKAELSVDAIVARVAAKRKDLEDQAAKTRKPRSKRRLLEKAAKISGTIITWLGKSLEAEGVETRAAIKAGRRPPRRHWVRGHWKVPYAKHKARTITWIMPYEKSKHRKQKVTGRTYRFDEDKS
jgi:hypothetical protein